MTETIFSLLTRLSEAGGDATLSGGAARPFYGAVFDRLLAKRILVEQAPLIAWENCDACECGIQFRPIMPVGNQFRAECPLDRREDVLLDPEDIRSFRIDPEALAREIGVAAGLGDDPSEIIDGVWHLGSTTSGRAVFLAFARQAVSQGLVTTAIRQSARSMAPTLLAPTLSSAEELRIRGAGIHVVPIRDCLSLAEGGTRLSLDVSLFEPAPDRMPRLVINQVSREVTLDGQRKALPPQCFDLLVILATAALRSPAIVENRHIEEKLWGPSIHRISSEVREPVRALRDALAKGASDPKGTRQLIKNRRSSNGYRLSLPPEEIELIA